MRELSYHRKSAALIGGTHTKTSNHYLGSFLAARRHRDRHCGHFGAELHALSVTAPVPVHPFAEYISPEKLEEIKATGCENRAAELKQYLDKFAADNPEYNVKNVLASVKANEGDAPKCILAAAKNMPVDMIVMGSRGRSPMGEIFIGSVAAKVTMKAKIPVVLVPIDS